MKTFGHCGACGDLICSLPTVKAAGGGDFYIGIREFRRFNWYENLVEQLGTLLKTQEYINEVYPWDGVTPVDYNLDDFRLLARHNTTMPLAEAHLRTFELQGKFDLKQPWLTGIESLHVADIVIGRSERFHDAVFDWSALEGYESRCAVIGFPEEHVAFEKLTGFNVRFLSPEELAPDEGKLFLQFARVIAGSKLFIGNSTFFWTLAEAMKVNRVMDVYYGYPNCMPQTENGHIKLTKAILRQYVGP